MAEQLLDGPQIGTGAEQMRSEAVAQRVRRGRLRQAQGVAEDLQPQLNGPWGKAPPLESSKQGAVRIVLEWTRGAIVRNGIDDDGQDRRGALLVALAGDGQRRDVARLRRGEIAPAERPAPR